MKCSSTLFYFCAFVFCAGLLVHADTSTTSTLSSQSVFLEWGNPQNIGTNGEYEVTDSQPAWLVGAYQSGGQWQTNTLKAWHVSSEISNDVGNLCILLDRSLIPSNLVARFHLLDCTNSALYVSLRDSRDEVVATNLVGNIMSGSLSIIYTNVTIPLMSYSNAVSIDLHRGYGEIMAFDTMLSLSAMNSTDSGANSEASNSGVSGRSLSALSGSLVLLPGTTVSSNISAVPANPVAGSSASQVPDAAPTAVCIIYVDRNIGGDHFSGKAPVVAGAEGPKKTVKRGLEAVSSGDMMIIKGGIYGENLNLSGKNVNVVIQGNVRL